DPRNRERSRETQRVRQVAKSLSEVEGGHIMAESFGADALRAAAAPFNAEPGRHDELVLDILIQPVFESGLQVLEAARPGAQRAARRAETAPDRPDRDAEILGDALGEFTLDVELTKGRGRIVAVE